MNNITLKNKTSSTITTDTYELEVDGQNITYIEYINNKNKVIDFNLRDTDGHEIDDAVFLDDIQTFVDKK